MWWLSRNLPRSWERGSEAPNCAVRLTQNDRLGIHGCTAEEPQTKTDMGVSWNWGTPKSFILRGFSLINPHMRLISTSPFPPTGTLARWCAFLRWFIAEEPLLPRRAPWGEWASCRHACPKPGGRATLSSFTRISGDQYFWHLQGLNILEDAGGISEILSDP